VRLPLISQGLIKLQVWPADTVTLGPGMVPEPMPVLLVAPLSQLIRFAPPSCFGSASISPVACALSQTGGLEPGTGVHGKASPVVACARSTALLAIRGE